ncbi:MAG TPA: hypothetical protein VGA16_06610 [Candidatus Limnocylindria bacterium]
MRRLGYVMTTLLLATALTGATAAARDIEWCAEDPVFSVLGSQFRITTSVATSASNVGALTYVVTLPSNAEGDASVQFPRSTRLPTSVELRYSGAPYSGTGTFTVSASATVSASTDADVTVDVDGASVTAATFSGRTNKAVRSQFDVTGR